MSDVVFSIFPLIALVLSATSHYIKSILTKPLAEDSTFSWLSVFLCWCLWSFSIYVKAQYPDAGFKFLCDRSRLLFLLLAWIGKKMGYIGKNRLISRSVVARIECSLAQFRRRVFK